MLLTQPRPLHSSICTAVLSLLTLPSLLLPSFSAPPYTHTHTEEERRKETHMHACAHTPAFIVISVLLHHDTPNHINSNNNHIPVSLNHVQRQCSEGISEACCVVVSKPELMVVFFCCTVSDPPCLVWLSSI